MFYFQVTNAGMRSADFEVIESRRTPDQLREERSAEAIYESMKNVTSKLLFN